MTLDQIVWNPILLPIPVAIIAFALAGLGVFHIIRKKSFFLPVKILRSLILVLIASLAVTINMRPMKESYVSDVPRKDMDVLFVVDTTVSMWANDSDGLRIDAAADDCRNIIKELDGAGFGLIRFDNDAMILAPFTTDVDNVLDALDTIEQPDSYYAKGSSINTPYQAMQQVLQSSAKKEGRVTVVFFLGDGEITDGSELESYADLKQYIDGGAVLGYGTAEGGTMKSDYGTVYGYDENGHYGEGVSKIDEQNLQQIADDLGVRYVNRTRKESLERVIRSIDSAAAQTVEKSKDAAVYDDLYYYLTPLLLLCIVAEGFFSIRKRKMPLAGKKDN